MTSIRTISKRHCFRRVLICFLMYCLILNMSLPVVLAIDPPATNALPGGGSVVPNYGSVGEFDYGTTNQLHIRDVAEQTVINWDSFDIGSEALTKFYQLGDNPAVLNRVAGDISRIFGTLEANGDVYIVNPAGVYFGAGSSVNVNQLVASGLGMTNTDFTNAASNPTEKMVFSGGSGNVTVEGVLNATGTGSVYLVGKNVTNNGAILCPDGLVVMAAGDTLRLGQPGSNIIVDISNINTDLVADSDNVVTNGGTVGENDSPAEKLVLAAGDVFSQAIANVDDVMVIARGDVELSDVAVTGDVEVYSGLGGATSANIDVEGSITAGSIKLQAGNPQDNALTRHNLNVDGGLHSTDGDIIVSALEHMTLNGDVLADNGGIYATADSDDRGRGNLNTRNLEATNDDIELIGRIIDIDGDAVAGGNMTIRAMRNVGYDGGGTVSAGTLQSIGNLDVSVRGGLTNDTIDSTGQITLSGDAVAGEDLILHNNTDMTASGAKLEAGSDIVLVNDEVDGACNTLTGNEDLTIRAGSVVDDGVIYAENTAISVTGSYLTLEQDLDLNLDNFIFTNQNNTDLTTKSNNGSVTVVETGTKPENAADMWSSVGATAQTNITLSGNTGDITTKQLTSATGDIEVNANAGSLFANEAIEATAGTVTLTADEAIYADDDIVSSGNLTMTAEDRIEAQGLTTTSPGNGDIITYSGYFTNVYGDVTSAGNLTMESETDDIELYENIEVAGNAILNAGGHIELATDSGEKSNIGGEFLATANSHIEIYGDVQAGDSIVLTADADGIEGGDVISEGVLTSTGGSITISASDDTIYLGDDVIANDYILLNNNTEAAGDLLAGTDVTVNGELMLVGGEWIFDEGLGAYVWDGDQYITAQTGTITAQDEIWKYTPGELHLFGGSPDLAIDLQNPGDLDDEDAAIATAGNLYMLGNGDVQIAGDVTTLGGFYWWDGDEYPEDPEGDVIYPAEVGGVSIISENGKIYTRDEADNDTLNVTIEGASSQADNIGVELPYDPDKKAAVVLISKEDLKLGSEGTLRAYGKFLALDETIQDFFASHGDFGDFLDSYSDWSDLIAAFEGDIEAFKETLLSSVNVEEIFESEEDYDMFIYTIDDIFEGYTGTDDRSAVGLLDVPDTIGGYPRNEGEPIDVAIYIASTGTDSDAGQGNIHLDILSIEVEHQGTMVIDAHDTITFGDLSEIGGAWTQEDLLDYWGFNSLEDLLSYMNFDTLEDLLSEFSVETLEDFLLLYYGEPEELKDGVFNIDRLEVVSRITEWLYQAVGRLPFAGNPDAIAALKNLIGGDYILRGAGLDNTTITDGRAWVLENLIPAAPLPENVEFQISGCPSLVQWTAEELGIEGASVQVWMVNTLASMRDIQPCDACANLKAAATVLQDAEGTHMAALEQVINEFASSTAPPSEEQMTSIADTIANNTEADNAYALAGEYLDALAAYVSIVGELGLTTEEAITMATDKYVAPLVEGDNVGLAAYVTARLTALGQ